MMDLKCAVDRDDDGAVDDSDNDNNNDNNKDKAWARYQRNVNSIFPTT